MSAAILASHSRIFGADELPDIVRIQSIPAVKVFAVEDADALLVGGDAVRLWLLSKTGAGWRAAASPRRLRAERPRLSAAGYSCFAVQRTVTMMPVP